MVVFTMVLSVAPFRATADDGEEQAKSAFNEGTRFYSAGKFTEAAEAFRKAYALKPSWKLLYNIGQAEASCKRHGLALDAFEKYLAEGGDEVPADRRDEVNGEIDRLRRIVGSISLMAPAGLTVWVDGVMVGTTPVPGRLRVAAVVEHQLELRNGDAVVDARRVVVAGQETIEVTMGGAATASVSPEGPVSPAPVAVAGPSLEERQLHKLKRQSKIFWIVGWVGVGVGVASLAGGVVMLAALGDLENGPYLMALGGAAAIAGTVFLIVSRRKKKRALAMESKVAFRPLLAPQLTGFVLEGRF